MRLAYLIGYGVEIEKSPVNRYKINVTILYSEFTFSSCSAFELTCLMYRSASLSMLSWPKPATWPSIPPDSSAEVMAKEKASIFQLCIMPSY